MTVGLWGCEAAMVVLVETRRWIYLMSYICTDRLNTSAPLCSPPLLVPCNKCCRNDLNMLLMRHTSSSQHVITLSPPRTRTRHPTGKAQDISELKSTTKIRGCKIFFPAVIPQIFPDTEPHSTGHAFCCLHLVTSQYSNIYACPNFYQYQTFLEY